MFLKLLQISLKNRKENSKLHKVQALHREVKATGVTTFCQGVARFKKVGSEWSLKDREDSGALTCGGEHSWAGYGTG